MYEIWETSKNAGTMTKTYEYGLLMIINTMDDGRPLYDASEKSAEYPYMRDGRYNISFDDVHAAGDIFHGGMWTIGFFHTHPSWKNATFDRVVGKTLGSGDPDPGNGIPAWVMDYEADDKDRDGTPTISPQGANTARGILTRYGGNGRIH
jgi:hypothetical protein